MKLTKEETKAGLKYVWDYIKLSTIAAVIVCLLAYIYTISPIAVLVIAVAGFAVWHFILGVQIHRIGRK